jgi:ATP-binding cassette subfamily B multidrug efflux pump
MGVNLKGIFKGGRRRPELDNRQTLRRLLLYIRPHIRTMALALGATLGLNALRSVQPLFTQYAIDWYITPKRPEGLKWLALAFVVIRVLTYLFFFYQSLLLGSFGQLITFDLRLELYKKLQRLDVAYFDNTPTGRIMTRLTSDLDVLCEFFTSWIKDGLGDMVLTASVVGIMFWTDWKMALVALSVTPCILLTLRWFQGGAQRGYRDLRLRLASLSAFLQEYLTGALTVQLFNHEEKALQKFHRINTNFGQAIKATDFRYTTFVFLLDSMGALSLTLVVGYGGWRVMNNMQLHTHLSIGELVAFILYAQQLLQPIRTISEKYTTYQSSMVAAYHVFEIMDQPVQIETVPEGKTGQARGLIEFQNVWFAYRGEDWVLKDVSFTIEPGETVAVIGHTGAGKTTLSNLLLRFYDARRGRILLDGVDVREWGLNALRANFAVMLQEVLLFRGTIEDNIRFGREDLTEEVIRRAAREACAAPFIESLPRGYKTVLKGRGVSLSAGQKQLIAFARALAVPSALLILDEATSLIDPQTDALIQSGIEHIIGSRTSLIIAHRPSTIKRADRIIVLHHGEVREQGTHAELMEAGGLYWRLQRLRNANGAALLTSHADDAQARTVGSIGD